MRSKLIPEPIDHLETMNQLDLENIDDTTVLVLALKSIEPKNSIKSTASNFQSHQEQVICPQTLSTCDTVPYGVSRSPTRSKERPQSLLMSKYDKKGHLSELYPTTRLNLSKPKLRLGLSKRAKCKPLLGQGV